MIDQCFMWTGISQRYHVDNDGGLVWKHPYIPMNKSYQEHSFIRLKCWKNLREKYELDLLKRFTLTSRSLVGPRQFIQVNGFSYLPGTY